MNSPLVINIQILQLFSCLKCTRQQILSTLRRQRSLATVLPIGTKRVSDWVCLSIIMGCRERESEREKERRCLVLLLMQHHSLCIDPAGWRCLHIVRIKIVFSLKKKKKKKEKEKNSPWFMQLCNKQTTMKWFVVGWMLSGIFPLVFT